MRLLAGVVTAGCPAGWCDSGPGNNGATSAGGVCARGAERAGPSCHGCPGAPQGHHHQLPCPKGETAMGWGGSVVPRGQRSLPPSSQALEVLVPNFPSDESRGFHKVPFQSTIYIEETDFREVSWAHWAILPCLLGATAQVPGSAGSDAGAAQGTGRFGHLTATPKRASSSDGHQGNAHYTQPGWDMSNQ